MWEKKENLKITKQQRNAIILQHTEVLSDVRYDAGIADMFAAICLVSLFQLFTYLFLYKYFIYKFDKNGTEQKMSFHSSLCSKKQFQCVFFYSGWEKREKTWYNKKQIEINLRKSYLKAIFASASALVSWLLVVVFIHFPCFLR